MPVDSFSQNPFALLSLIAAPAVLTNATSVLALSTSNRFLRASERMRALNAQLEAGTKSEAHAKMLLTQVNRVEKQAVWLLSALRGAYVALASFAIASLISIVGAGLASTPFQLLSRAMVALALVAGFIGAGGLVWGCTHLFRATQYSMLNILEEAALIRERQAQKNQVA